LPKLPALPKSPKLILASSTSIGIQTARSAGSQFGFFGNCHFWQLLAASKTSAADLISL
jgi:hypothetical protein